ncbi:bifunctional cobalt-precorrin-7 (C(5))-methyltransferase/cobalt-precorrin-6B (C(15))-methyltransferase [Rugosimonospora acidiphila]|uniref:Bifunctional cobalt-precorrin-7 (C(5))-methyltransferase/cobalt-precorrin-6B (C(15))-methyltransferase n=1 Tax=Rugosimonospora acidiphila TaxID=556531 RepID=A0ABP9SFK2_9ACTN
MRTVTVVGCPGVVPGTAAEPVAAATLIAGPERILSTVDNAAAERVVMGDVPAALDRIAGHDGPVVVLASGDPGFFGIVRALRRRGLDVDVRPAPSSVAVAFARIGMPWDDALVVSAHGRALRPAVNACRAYPKVAVLTGPGTGPAELGAALSGLPRRFVVAERLGAPGERITETDPVGAAAATWRDPNVVLVLAEAAADAPRPWLSGAPPAPDGWALPDDSFDHRDSMITKAEVRALALARLGPRLGDLVWDVGAGSGSVAVECARFGAAVLAVERDPAARATIHANAGRLGVEVAVVAGEAPGCLADLPDPDAVFVGGGGIEVLGACLARAPGRVVAAYAAVERVGPALTALSAGGYRAQGVQVQANRLSALPGGAHRLAATNPVYLVSGVLS